MVQHLCAGKAIYSGVRSQATGNDTPEEPCKCPSQTAANAPPVTAIQCDHQIQTREGNAARRCTEQVPLMSFWGNQTGYESRLHCLQQDLDSQTQGYHQRRPHSWHGLPAHSAGGGHIKGGILPGWPGCTGTSETSSPQTRDCS